MQYAYSIDMGFSFPTEPYFLQINENWANLGLESYTFGDGIPVA